MSPSADAQFSENSAAASQEPALRIEMRIQGLDSAETARKAAELLSQLTGVLGVEIDRANSTAIITMEPNYPISMVAIIATLEQAGFTVPGVLALDRDQLRVVGQWQGFLGPPDDRVELVIDIAIRANGKPVAEIDIPVQSLENFPLNVIVRGDSVFFSLSNVDLAGTIAADGQSISGRLVRETDEVPLELSRVGEAQVSDDGLAFEALVLNTLSRNASELRDLFNVHADKVRLIMLLAPS